MALSPARRLSALTSTLRCQGGDDDEISKISFAPSLRIDAQLEMLTQEALRYLLLVLPRYLGAVYLYLAQQDLAGIRQQDQVGWSEGGPHIVIRQYTFVDGAWARERLQTHGGTVNVANLLN